MKVIGISAVVSNGNPAAISELWRRFYSGRLRELQWKWRDSLKHNYKLSRFLEVFKQKNRPHILETLNSCLRRDESSHIETFLLTNLAQYGSM